MRPGPSVRDVRLGGYEASHCEPTPAGFVTNHSPVREPGFNRILAAKKQGTRLSLTCPDPASERRFTLFRLD